MNVDDDKQAATPDCDCRGKGETTELNTAKKCFSTSLFVHPSLKYKMQRNIWSVKWEIRQDIFWVREDQRGSSSGYCPNSKNINCVSATEYLDKDRNQKYDLCGVFVEIKVEIDQN